MYLTVLLLILFYPFFFKRRYPVVPIVHQTQRFLARMFWAFLFEFVEDFGILVEGDGINTLLRSQVALLQALFKYLIEILCEELNLRAIPTKGTSLRLFFFF